MFLQTLRFDRELLTEFSRVFVVSVAVMYLLSAARHVHKDRLGSQPISSKSSVGWQEVLR